MIALSYLPPLGELKGALMQPGDVPRTEADVTDLVENLGYKPNTPVQKGIERFIKWYKQYFFLGDAHGTTLNSKLHPVK